MPDGRISFAETLADPRFLQPLSGLYWQVQDDARPTLLRSRSLWDAVIELPQDDLRPGRVHQHVLTGPAQQPLLVLFEQGDCHGCDVLHTEAFSEPDVRQALRSFEIVQLDMWADTPVLTPGGKRLSARNWAAALGLFYAPSLVFFDEGGQEIIRIDSVVRFHRLARVLRYVASGAYKKHRNFQQ